MSVDFELAKSYLQVADEQGATLYDHLASLLLSIIKDKPDPDQALEQLERFSLSLKSAQHTPQQFKELPSLPSDPAEKTALLERLNHTLATVQAQVLRREARLLAREGEVQTQVASVLELSQLLEQAGVSLAGSRGEEVLKLHLSIQRLVESQAKAEAQRPKQPGQGDLTLSSARFWGIVRGTRRDYYVVEATRARYPLAPAKPRILNADAIAAQKAERRAMRLQLQQEKERLQREADEAEARGEDPPEVITPRPPVGVLKQKRIKPIYDKREPAGQGANQFVYFVSNSLEAAPPASGDATKEWVLLPDLDAGLVPIARRMRRLFTGELDAPVGGWPRWEGSEADYLRTQIARISASTLVSPSGFYASEENESGVESVRKEEYEPLPAAELLTPENWVHHRSHLLRAGRTSVWEEPEKSEDEEEEEEDESEEEEEEEEPEPEEEGGEEQEPDEPLPLLSSLEDDASRGLKALWSFRATPLSSTLQPTPHSLAVARSLLWPGALSVARKEKSVCVYVGDGQKYLPFGFTPAPPPKIQSEFEPAFDPEEAEEDGAGHPLHEQSDPLPPVKNEDEDEDGEDDEEDEEEEEEEEEEEDNDDDDDD